MLGLTRARLLYSLSRRSSSSSAIDDFVQDPPQLHNVYLQDVTLKSFFSRYVPEKANVTTHEDLTRFGELAAIELPPLARQCEVEKPWLEQFDAYGKRIDKLHVSSAWKEMHGISAKEGLVSIAYEDHGQYSRLYQVCKLMLFASTSGLYSCPLAMTDGAIKILKSIDGPVSQTALGHLLSRSPESFWTSGQWMTEKRGGSDVAAGTETTALNMDNDDGEHLLSGYKWFTSASDADMALTLARSFDAEGWPIPGKEGLSLYYINVKENFNLGTITTQRLKDKLGTRQLPTAELLLDGCVATKLSDTGRGIPAISPMLTVTRVHNAISAVSVMRRIIMLARDYCDRRMAFNSLLRRHGLHIQTLARMEVHLSLGGGKCTCTPVVYVFLVAVWYKQCANIQLQQMNSKVECRGCTLMVLETARLLSLQEKGNTSAEQDALLRIQVPLTKLYTGKQAVAVVSEGLEAFGGLGYLEDTGLPTMLRDAQVLPIWEGTTNILSLDVLRAMGSKDKTFAAAISSVMSRASESAAQVDRLSPACATLTSQCQALSSTVAALSNESYSVAARDLAFSLSRLIIGSLLVDHAAWSQRDADVTAALRWCSRVDLCPLSDAQHYSQTEIVTNSDLVFDT